MGQSYMYYAMVVCPFLTEAPNFFHQTLRIVRSWKMDYKLGMTVTDKLRSMQNNLADNPLYYASLTSKELFHSNMWYWFSRLNRAETAKLFYPSVRLLAEDQFRREDRFEAKNLTETGQKKWKATTDLSIVDGKEAKVIVECKVKDYPKDEQLRRIQRAVDSDSTKFVLVSLSPYETALNSWDVVSFKELHDRLQPKRLSADQFEVAFIRKYKELLASLVELEASLPNGNSYDFAISHNQEIFVVLNEMKLWELYQKKRASHFLSYAKTKINCDIAEYSINNQKATISFKVQVAEDTLLGIQLEDRQYRRFVEGTNAQSKAEKLLGIYFDESFKSSHKHLFLKYGESFRHQFTEIDEGTPYEDLVEKISADIKEIHRIKPNID